jgi:hypothetical protein
VEHPGAQAVEVSTALLVPGDDQTRADLGEVQQKEGAQSSSPLRFCRSG